MRAKFLPPHDQILRDVYPMFGSKGVVDILPQFNGKQVNGRAYTLGIKKDVGWQKTLAMAKQSGHDPDLKKIPDRPTSRDIYPIAVERLAFARPWV